MEKEYRILSLNANKLFENSKGYKIDNTNNKLSKDYKSVIDNCLEIHYLQKVLRKKIGYTVDKYNVLDEFINVSFDYSLYKYNVRFKDKKNKTSIYVRNGYFDEDINSIESHLADSLYIKNNELIAVKTGEAISNPNEITKGLFNVVDGKYEFIRENNVVKSPVELRKYFYENGITIYINGTKREYVRYKRSTGASREGDCLFIDKSLFDKMSKWSRFGIDVNDKNRVSFEAYQSLTLSGIQKTIEIEPKNVLVVEDYESIFEDSSSIYFNTSEDKKLFVDTNGKVKNNIWDGEGLLDESIFEDNGYSEKGMLLLRNQFFKSCCFNTKLQKWFTANNITEINQLNGYTEATSISDIKLVITDSSLKYLKLSSKSRIEKIKRWMEKVDKHFGVVKTDKKTRFFSGSMTQTNYQLLNTLDSSYPNTFNILKPTLDVRDLINTDPLALQLYLKNISKDNDDDYTEDNDDGFFDFKNKIVLELLKINEDFDKTSLYKKFKKNIINSINEKIKNGKLLVSGTNATIFGNGYELLKEIIKQFDHNNPTSVLKNNQIMCKAFKEEKILCARSPHITMGNLYKPDNVMIKEYNDWFNLSNEIVCVNAINENIQQRLNGCDYDSDFMLITDNKLLVDSVNTDEFKVPVCLAATSNKSYTEEELYKLDNDICDNRIGEIVNLSQHLNSIYWEQKKKGNIELAKAIYNHIGKLAVLSGMEIDKAKRIYNVSCKAELEAINKEKPEDSKAIPVFLNYIKNSKVKIKNKKRLEREYDTVMDYIYQIKEKNRCKSSHTKEKKLFDIINKNLESSNTNSAFYRKKANEALDILKNVNTEIEAIKVKYNDENYNKKLIMQEIQNSVETAGEDIAKRIDREYTLNLILKDLKNDEDETLEQKLWILLYSLYEKQKDVFIKLFKTKQQYEKLVEENTGNYHIFDKNYAKINKNLE